MSLKVLSDRSKIKTETTEQGFKYWINRPFIANTLRAELQVVDVLLLPKEEIRGIEGAVFPSDTEIFWNFLKEKLPEEVTSNICISDDNYQEYLFHSELVIITDIIVQNIVAPAVAQCILNYIKPKGSQ